MYINILQIKRNYILICRDVNNERIYSRGNSIYQLIHSKLRYLQLIIQIKKNI